MPPESVCKERADGDAPTNAWDVVLVVECVRALNPINLPVRTETGSHDIISYIDRKKLNRKKSLGQNRFLE